MVGQGSAAPGITAATVTVAVQVVTRNTRTKAAKSRQSPSTVAKEDFRSAPGRMPRPNAWVCTDTAWLSEPTDGRVSVDRRISSVAMTVSAFT
jgi:hypothetical protein